jgi:hypothetical protein
MESRRKMPFHLKEWFFPGLAKKNSDYLVPMASAERIVLVVCLFGGFMWLRQRSRTINLERQMGRALAGVFLLLPALLFGEKWLFDRYHLTPWTDMLLKALVTAANFPLVGYLFLKPAAPETGAAEPPGGDAPVQ